MLALRSALLALAAADLPVHCLRHQVQGDWEFSIGDASSQRSSCGHRRPDNSALEPQVAGFSEVHKVRVSLGEPNRAQVTDGGDLSLLEAAGDGSWTMIYDEGFEVQASGVTFFAFSKFDLFERDGQQVNVSHCDQTMVGWFHNAERTQFGCFHGKKVGGTPRASLASFVPAVAPKSVQYDEPLDYTWHQNQVQNLNLLQQQGTKTWTAQVYDKFVGKSPRELNKMMGIKRSHPISAMKAQAQPQRSFLRAQPIFLSEQADTSSLKSERYDEELLARERDLPATFDWRNVNGKNYLEPVMDQGDCGSCYVVSSMRMLSARNKLRTQDADAEPFSISFPLYCSEYNQGCDGGYAFLLTKWSEDVGLIPAKCDRYVTNGQCEASCVGDGPKLRATNHRYVGGYYGGATAAQIMDELVSHGPVVVSLEPKSDLMYYSGGIYESGSDEIHQEWERVDHAVLLVGYGEENGKKYWIVQNSWGPEWGEQGFFRIARGINDSGIESIAVAADVTEDQRSGVEEFLAQGAQQLPAEATARPNVAEATAGDQGSMSPLASLEQTVDASVASFINMA